MKIKPLASGPSKEQSYLEPTQKEIAEGYRQLFGGEVDIWHFPMMNDSVRNDAYEKALSAAIKKEHVVLDIGTGSGLLAMLSAKHGASHVVTCEEISMIATKAKEIIARNGFAERIQVINKLSTDIVVGKDIPQKADLLVTEIFDDGLLGEGAFIAIEHARKHLLKPGAQVIPRGVKVMAMCIESQEILENHRVTTASGFDVSGFNEFSIKGYMGYHLDKMQYKPLTAPQQIFEFDFYNLPGAQALPIQFKAIANGTCHAVAFWYQLQMDEHTTISTAPGLPRLSCWKQAIFLLDSPQEFTQGESRPLTAHHNTQEIWFS